LGLPLSWQAVLVRGSSGQRAQLLSTEHSFLLLDIMGLAEILSFHAQTMIFVVFMKVEPVRFIGAEVGEVLIRILRPKTNLAMTFSFK